MGTIDLNIPIPEVFVPLLSPARYKGAHGGRASGKSYFFAGQVIAQALTGKNIVCLREIQKSLDESAKRLIERMIEHYDLFQYFTIRDKKILGPKSNQIIFQGLQNHTADSIKSLEGYDLAWVEEAHSVSSRSLEILIPTFRTENSELWFSWNPDHKDDPVDVLLRGPDKPADSIVVSANYYDNPFFPEVLRPDLERDRERDPDKFAHIWLGQYRKASEALIFKNWRVSEFGETIGAEYRFGVDWGFANDPTALVRCNKVGKILYIDHALYGEHVSVDLLPDFLARVPDSQRWPMIADNARPELIDYCQSHGYPLMIACQKGKGSVEDGIDFIKSYDLIIHPRCEALINELSNYQYKIDKYTGQVLPVIPDGQADHCIDALRYAVESVRRMAGDSWRQDDVFIPVNQYS